MNFNLPKSFATALPLIFMSSMLSSVSAADECEPTPAATCYPDSCACTHCLGPDNMGGNAPVRPKTCNSDFAITVSGFYWNAHQDGMEYAIKNNVAIDGPITQISDFGNIVNLIDAEYQTPNYKWDFGFKLGVGYTGCHDGWDVGVLWTWYRGKSSNHIEAEYDDNTSILPLWSAYAPLQGGPLFATDVEESWNLRLNLVDFELGREFWTSKYMSIRPHVGIRYASIKQDFDITYRGGSWGTNTITGNGAQAEAFTGLVSLDNDFTGAGIRAGLDSTFHLGCGWGVYGNFAASLVYGRFSIDHDEKARQTVPSFNKGDVLGTSNNFRASRAMLDLGLGLQWSALFCDCGWAFTAMLGWEQHLFFDQNQLWRVNRVGAVPVAVSPNLTGENVYSQRRGDLDTQGWTLTFKFEF